MAEVNRANFFLGDNGLFVIENYQKARPFASFLPGIAGPMGVPLWVFYVNRGQAVASFGVEDKDKPILEYQSANHAYQQTASLGFRTFFRLQALDGHVIYEPFRVGSSSQKMSIGANELVLQDRNTLLGLQTDVVYFLLPGENLAGLVRMVTVTNQSDRSIGFEMLDGLPAVIPFGVNDRMLKDIGRTVEAWMEVFNIEKNVPFYHLRASVADINEVNTFEAGHYMLAFQKDPAGSRILPAVVDPALVFGQNTALSEPDAFLQGGLAELLGKTQIVCGKTPCGFSALEAKLGPGESVQLNSLFGHVERAEHLRSRIDRLTSDTYLYDKRREANDVVDRLTDVVDCETSSPVFDAYCRQTFLDNTLRGGWPITFGSGMKKRVIHIYSRKHGDLERDYNAFSIAPEFYSQGNGSYRDVNQNRREDVWFHPEVGDFNIRVFMSLIQLDGYNPLVIRGSRFFIPPERVAELLSFTGDPEKLRSLLELPFSPGMLLKEIADRSISLTIDKGDFLEKIIGKSSQSIQADFGEGYWVDHWTYNLDLIESYLTVFPDCLHELVFSSEDLPFYDGRMVIQPRSKKYLLIDGRARQINGLYEDQEKAALQADRSEDSCWVHKEHGKGEIYRTSLFTKLFILAIIKFATLDPMGMGIEMEAGRPGWYDAMNGLPGLFGSSVPETYALKQLILFMLKVLRDEKALVIRLPVEIGRFLQKVINEIKQYYSTDLGERDYRYWDNVSTAREEFRASVRLGLDGTEEELSLEELRTILEAFKAKVEAGIARALELNNHLPPTYFIFRGEDLVVLKDEQGRNQTDPQGRSYIRVGRFIPEPLPLFLEGMVRAMKGLDGTSAKSLYQKVKTGPLFDRKLKMYKVNESLETLPNDVGRARAFPRGWLENESIWLHMEYKYLLEVLLCGLYQEFFDDLNTSLIPFLDPNIYGRSLLENSSFIVSSVHPDETLHGMGFVARLSGATAEFLSLWIHMMAGARPFFVQDGKLCLAFSPILPGWLFNKQGIISFKFLGQTTVNYHNPKRKDTFDPQSKIISVILNFTDDQIIKLAGPIIPSPYAQRIRDGHAKKIDVYLE